MNKFAERLKELREEKNISQMELGVLTGISQSAIGRYELKERMPTIDNVISLCKFFGVTSDYLIGLED